MSGEGSNEGRGPGPAATHRLAIVLAAVIGVCIGVGGYTLHYAEALSYLSSDPAACANCHIMEPQYASWQRASHREVAGCVDCHLPQAGLAKWIAKADNGYRHSWAFTFQDFHEPIQITPANRRILQTNCLACHGSVTHDLAAGRPDAVQCVHCHQSAGHGERVAVGGREGS